MLKCVPYNVIQKSVTFYFKVVPVLFLFIYFLFYFFNDFFIWLLSLPWKWKVKVKLLSRVHRFTTPQTVAYQAPPFVDFSRQEYWSGLHSLLQGIFPTQGLNPGLPHCRQMLYHLSHQETLFLITALFLVLWFLL